MGASRRLDSSGFELPDVSSLSQREQYGPHHCLRCVPNAMMQCSYIVKTTGGVQRSSRGASRCPDVKSRNESCRSPRAACHVRVTRTPRTALQAVLRASSRLWPTRDRRVVCSLQIKRGRCPWCRKSSGRCLPATAAACRIELVHFHPKLLSSLRPRNLSTLQLPLSHGSIFRMVQHLEFRVSEAMIDGAESGGDSK